MIDIEAIKMALKECEGHLKGRWTYFPEKKAIACWPVMIGYLFKFSDEANAIKLINANGHLIALAPHIPALLAEVERLQSKVTDLENDLAGLNIAYSMEHSTKNIFFRLKNARAENDQLKMVAGRNQAEVSRLTADRGELMAALETMANSCVCRSGGWGPHGIEPQPHCERCANARALLARLDKP